MKRVDTTVIDVVKKVSEKEEVGEAFYTQRKKTLYTDRSTVQLVDALFP